MDACIKKEESSQIEVDPKREGRQGCLDEGGHGRSWWDQRRKQGSGLFEKITTHKSLARLTRRKELKLLKSWERDITTRLTGL